MECCLYVDVLWVDNVFEKGKARQNHFLFPKILIFPGKAVFYIKLNEDPFLEGNTCNLKQISDRLYWNYFTAMSVFD